MAAFPEGARTLFCLSGAIQPPVHFFAEARRSPLKQSRSFFTGLAKSSPAYCQSATVTSMDALRQKWQNLQFRLGRDPRRAPANRKKVVVLGTGWGSMNFLLKIDVAKYDVTVISPRNFFAFTPLLPSVCAGTLSPRSCLTPVREKLFRGGKKVMNFHEAFATSVDSSKNSIKCKAVNGEEFDVPYDYLVVAVGAETNTFGIPGVLENAHFLKEVENARSIQKQVLDNFEAASIPGVLQEEKERLMHFVVVGGGPTGVETAAETLMLLMVVEELRQSGFANFFLLPQISDFVHEDAKRHFPSLVPLVKVTLIEMLPRVLPMFHQNVSDFTLNNMEKMQIETLLKTRVTKVTDKYVSVVDANNEARDLPCGFVLWASGVGQVPFVKKLMQSVDEQKANRIMRVNEKLEVIGCPNIYAMGDCTWFTPKSLEQDVDSLFKVACTTSEGPSAQWLQYNAKRLAEQYPQIATFDFSSFKDAKKKLTKEQFQQILVSIDKGFKVPPPTAQNATQEGKYLAGVFNAFDQNIKEAPAYCYNYRGSMAYVGNGQSVIQMPNDKSFCGGFMTNILWKLFYLNEQMSLTNKCLCLFDWSCTRLRGRDVGRDHTQQALPKPPQ